jgi:predicted ATP-grasp superfamily ATP-dependent carboligase
VSADVLVLDALERKAVPVIRALARGGLRVAAGESTPWAMGLFSRACRRRYLYPPPEDEAAFVAWLLEHARAGAWAVILPLDERTMAPVTRWRDELARHAAVPVVDHATYTIARDKRRTLQAAAGLGVPAPRTWWFTSVEEFRARREEIELPVVLKPRSASGSRGVRYVRSTAQLEAAYVALDGRYPQPLVQEWIPPGGETYGVELLLDHGEVVAEFVHRRLREYPVAGGPSTLRESVHDKALVDQAARLLGAIGWHGVAMVEFKVDPRDGVPRLMEINAKFWGSIALPILCGVNFPLLLYRLARGEHVAGPAAYPAGVRSRWLIPGDLLHFLTNPDRWRLSPSFFDLRSAPDDILDWRDPGPLAGMALSFLARARHRAFWTDTVWRTRRGES